MMNKPPAVAGSRTNKIYNILLAKSLHQQEHNILIKEQHIPVESASTTTGLVPNTTMKVGVSSVTLQEKDFNQVCGANTLNQPQLFNNVNINDIIILDESLVPLQQDLDCDNGIIDTLINETIIADIATSEEYNNSSQGLENEYLQNEGFQYNSDIDYQPNTATYNNENLVLLQQNKACNNNDINIGMIIVDESIITSTRSEEDGVQTIGANMLPRQEFESNNSDDEYQPNTDTNNSSNSDESNIATHSPNNNKSGTKNKNQANAALGSTTENENELTKKGTLRKRKKKCRKESKEVVNMKRIRKDQDNHELKLPCNDSCKRNCKKNISETRRQQINMEFWTLNWSERRMFVLHNTKKMGVKRRSQDLTEATSRRSETISYYLKDESGEVHQVCKVFYLTTLGFSKKNDTILKRVLHQNESDVAVSKDMRGKHAKHEKVDRQILQNHVKKYNPCVSHYRREHAPNRLYLPSDVTIKGMHNDFQKECPDLKCSYELYRHVVVKEMNISFAHLGHEECEICENHRLHDVSHSRENLNPNCEICKSWQVHKKQYTNAREVYKEDVNKSRMISDTLFFSADLQKVIMLPRLEMFKSVIFTPRIIAFNESFVPLGTNSKFKPVATIWHEAIAGRNKEEIISCFHQFFILQRDSEKIVVWLDNCSAQNKNWALMSFLIYIVNSAEIETKEICLKFFEKGHTFMSADSFHHQVEMALKKLKKVYDFADFCDCIKSANSGRVLVKEMRIEDFSIWSNYSSQTALKKIKPRPYLSEMVEIKVVRGSLKLMYKNEFEHDYTEIAFLQKKYAKTGCPKPRPAQNYRGISTQKKEKLLKALSGIMPASRLNFWENLPVSETATDLITHFE